MATKQEREGYGYSLRSPIHVSGFDEERIYIDNLRVLGGDTPPQIRRIGSNFSAETGHPIDLYEVTSGGILSQTDYLYVDLYGASDWRAPEGYALRCERPKREGGEPEHDLGEDLQEMIRLTLKRNGDE